ncbi:MAG TPA: aminotransferase class I/II-fold pyridoxal phosphate-dependent enzyme [Candidatus Saccharimonadales bacterium]|nr:aminotransferase class I/II-fold pyridoxal phosphate-dependent enzyme [Candidatus Saccharimonadales bacterium]
MNISFGGPRELEKPTTQPQGRIRLKVADEREREGIYLLRHEVYGRELQQYPLNGERVLKDSLDAENIYLVLIERDRIAGFISITPPTARMFSIDKYFRREELPFQITPKTYEVRLLTVLKEHRGRELATLLMYAAFRWVESHGGDRVIAIGRTEILELYLRAGLQPTGFRTQAGAVAYDLLSTRVETLRKGLNRFSGVLTRVEQDTEWDLSFPFRKPAPCFHGGVFFKTVGENFSRLERHQDFINADVLDAWFPPAPGVIESLKEHLSWILRTSPPAACTGLIETIAGAREVSPENILPGAGSSDSIFRALGDWLKPASNALILDPTYGEYAHVLERVIGCTVDRLPLEPESNYAVDLQRLENALRDAYDLIVLVNPNSPTGHHILRDNLQRVLRKAPSRTRIWIDETYVEYAGPEQSLERFAADSENVVVCKSMSKVYALSGARVAYLCAGAHQLESLRAITPPWAVSLPAQLAAVRALQDPGYYAARYSETARLRMGLGKALLRLGWKVHPGIANFLLCQLPEKSLTAAELVERCQQRGLFLRDASAMGTNLGPRVVRIAVKDEPTNARMIDILRSVI